MLYNTSGFLWKAIKDNLYNKSVDDNSSLSPPIPPVGFVFLIDNDGDYAKDSDGNFVIVAQP